jgi:DNA-directed RNA polymerase subunit RPC12/RpoP
MNVLSKEQQELVDSFVASIEFGPIFRADVRPGDPIDTLVNQMPEGYYPARSVCDNCSSGVYLYVAKGVAHPAESPEIACPECGVTGSVYKPPSELEQMRAFRRIQDAMGRPEPDEDEDLPA